MQHNIKNESKKTTNKTTRTQQQEFSLMVILKEPLDELLS